MASSSLLQDAAVPNPHMCNSSFVTVLANYRYLRAAKCLPAQLQSVGAACPIHIIYNDADHLLQQALPSLEGAYGSRKVLPLSRLKARYYEHTLRNATPSKVGRRLFDRGEVSNTHLKLWLWALPMAHAIFLDIDILVLRNINELLHINPPADGIGAVTCKSKYGERYFNSGLIVLRPSLRMLQKLLQIERWASHPWNGHIPREGERWPDICAPDNDPDIASRLFPNSTHALRDCRAKNGPGRTPALMSKACESKYTDQSIFNHIYRSHLSVPGTYNDASRFNIHRSHIIHFVGEPKPWDAHAMHRGRGDVGNRGATIPWTLPRRLIG
jgi:hypothetical protein